MASECELLQFNLYSNGQADANVYEALSQQMPRDIEITEVKMFGEKVKFNPAAITYFLPFDMNTATREKIGNIKDAFDAGLPLMTERVSHKTGKRKSVDLAELIRTIEELDDGVLMSVKMVNGTTVKLDEMPALFGIDSSQLRGAVVRKKIEWEVK
jgi:hypothetical protein